MTSNADFRLYREVCGLLFFRYGVTPTANKLYSLVRKGSMGTPAEGRGPRPARGPGCGIDGPARGRRTGARPACLSWSG